jgi:hypothetical protein
VTYPEGYGTQLVTLDQMRAKHGPKMHPEFYRRFFAYIEHKGGLLGVGGGWRAVQPVKPGFAPPGKSFHESQDFKSGISAYCAVDLVAPVAGGKHRSPTWDECADAPDWGLHTFVTGEPWHIQPIEIRGFVTWAGAGRPDPGPFTLPGTLPPTEPPKPPIEGDTMLYIATPAYPGKTDASEWWAVFQSGVVRRAVSSDVKYAQGAGIPLIAQDSLEHDQFLRSIATG